MLPQYLTGILNSNPCFSICDIYNTGIMNSIARLNMQNASCFGCNCPNLTNPYLAWYQVSNQQCFMNSGQQYFMNPGQQHFLSQTPQGIYPPNGTSLDSTPETEGNTKEDRENYTKLKNIAKLLLEEDALINDSGTLYDNLKEAVEKNDGTYEEKSNAIKTAINAIKETENGEKILNNAITSSEDFKIISKSNKSETLNERLIKIGLKKSDKTDLYIRNFKKDLSSDDLDDTDETFGPNGIAALIGQGNIHVLDFISAWNSQENKGVFDYLNKTYSGNKLEDYDIVNSVVTPMVEALIAEANKFSSDPKITSAIDELNNSLNKCDVGKIDNNLQKKFDKLYILVRLAAAKNLDADIKRNYNGIGIDIFETDKYLKETKADIKKEIRNNSLSETDEEIITNEETISNEEVDSEEVDSEGVTDNDETDDDEAEEAKALGITVANNLRNNAAKEKAADVNTSLENVDEDNVMDFLDGLYSVNNRQNNYFERMDKRNKGQITKENRLQLINSLLTVAENCGLDNDTTYKKLEKIADNYGDEGCKKDKTNFKSRNRVERKWWDYKHKKGAVLSATLTGAAVGTLLRNPIGTLIGAAAGFFTGMAVGKVSDAEVIDDCIQDLHDKIKQKQNPTQAQAQTINTIG